MASVLTFVAPAVVAPARAHATGAVTGSGGLFVPATGRVLDTRSGNSTDGLSAGPFSANTWHKVQIEGQAGLPSSGMSAVEVSFTVVNPTSAGNLYAYQGGVTAPPPAVTYVNYVAAGLTTNSAVIAVGSAGAIQVEVTTSANVLVDVEGYYTTGTTAPGGFVALPATSIASTVDGSGGLSEAKVASGASVNVHVAGVDGIASDASSVMLSIEDTSPSTTTSGNLTPYPTGGTRPSTSLDWAKGQNAQWTTPVQVGTGGDVTIYINSGGPVNVTVIAAGYFTATTSATDAFTPAQARVFDSRSPSAPLGSGGTRTVQVAGVAGVPPAGSGIDSVVVNVAVLAPAGVQGHIQAFADDGSPGPGYLQFYASTTTSVMMVVPLGADGGIAIQNTSGGSINFVVDVEGWYFNPGGAISDGQTQTQRYVDLDSQSAYANLVYAYRSGITGAFSLVPASQVYPSGSGTAISAWPVSGNTAYEWDAQQTFGTSASGVIQVEACEDQTLVECTLPQTVEYSPADFSSSLATQQVGPGDLALQTGNFELSATDFSATTALGVLSVSRTLTTEAPAGADGMSQTAAQGIFGPAWVSDIDGADAGDSDLSVGSGLANGVLDFVAPDGTASAFQATTSTSAYPISFAAIGDAASTGAVVSMPSSQTITMTDSDGTVTTWSDVTGSWGVASVVEAGQTSGSAYTYTSGMVSSILAPSPSGVSCAAAPTTTPGCRSLLLSYELVTTPSGSQAERLASVTFAAPVSAGVTNNIEVEAYDYYPSTAGTEAGMLEDAYDPRISPALKTFYSYNGYDQLLGVTPPEEKLVGTAEPLDTWVLGYNGSGQLTTLSEINPATSESDATTTIVYGMPLAASGLPDLSGDSAGPTLWGETSDLPVTATAIFPPSHVPASTTVSGMASTDWPYATLDYLDVNGRQVNSASFGDSQWLIDSTQYDSNGNQVWSLTAGNRAQALGTAAATDPYVASFSPGAPRALYLASTVGYNPEDPSELTESIGPMHLITLKDGTTVDGIDQTTTTYVKGTNDQGQPYDLASTVTSDVEEFATDTGGVPTVLDESLWSTYPDAQTTVYGYAAVGSMTTAGAGGTPVTGYDLFTPTTTTTRMGASPSSADLTTTTVYNAQGQQLSTSLPKDTATTGAQTQVSSYYTSTGTGACVNPALAGMLCRTAPAAQPASGPALPVTTYSYDALGDTTSEVQVSGSETRTTTATYDPAGRPLTQSVSISPALGVALPEVTYSYDPTTGLPTGASTGASPTGQSITESYNNLGQVSEYIDGNGQSTTTSYDADGNPITVANSAGETTYSYGADNTSPGAADYRDVVTSENINVSGQPSTFTASYDADGNVATVVYPNGLTATTGYDDTDQPTSLSYTLGSSTWMSFTATKGQGGQTVAETSPGEEDAYSYDEDGRLTQVQDTTAASGSQPQQCTTSEYAFDADSNRTSLTSYAGNAGGTCATSTVASSSSSSFDAADRITNTGYTYDAFGRTLTVPASDAIGQGAFASVTGTLSLSYYANDMIAQENQGSQQLSYTLDPLQDRIASATVGTGSNQVVTTNDYADMSDSPAWSTVGGVAVRDVRGPGGLLAATVSNSTVTLQLTNLDGSVVATAADSASDAGITTNSYTSFNAYGVPENAAATTETYGWEGGNERSAESLGGLLLMGARLYNPAAGRFLSVDAVYGGNANPYVYPANPVGEQDLSGTSKKKTINLHLGGWPACHSGSCGWEFNPLATYSLEYAVWIGVVFGPSALCLLATAGVAAAICFGAGVAYGILMNYTVGSAPKYNPHRCLYVGWGLFSGYVSEMVKC